jgi:uncharacterized membrane protein YcaP (DUF421 family)
MTQELLGVAVRLSVMYLYALAVMRLTGKRTLGNLSTQDFITTLIVGDLFDDIFWGTAPLGNGLLAISMIAMLQIATEALAFQFRPVRVWLTGTEPVLVVKNGRFQRKGMDSQRSPEDDIRSGLRDVGEENLSEVREAYWEPNGQLSVLKKEDAKPAQKSDAERLRKMLP